MSSTAKTFYKATRPDGTDFWTGTIRYEVGKRVRPRPIPEGWLRQICNAGYLHAADVPAEVLVAGEWPCRLFEVTGKPAAGFDARHPHKGAFRQLRVMREIDAHLAFGPNGRDVVRLIERARRLTAKEVIDLSATRYAGWAAAWAAAWCAAWCATRYAAWCAAGDAAWAAARSAAGSLVVRDLISTGHFDALYGSWATIIDAKDAKERLD